MNATPTPWHLNAEPAGLRIRQKPKAAPTNGDLRSRVMERRKFPWNTTMPRRAPRTPRTPTRAERTARDLMPPWTKPLWLFWTFATAGSPDARSQPLEMVTPTRLSLNRRARTTAIPLPPFLQTRTVRRAASRVSCYATLLNRRAQTSCV